MNALAIESLSFNYGKKQALKDVSFHVSAGKFCALLGPNGAGKSTLLAILTGLIAAQSGDVRINGHSLSNHPRAALRHLGIVFQQSTLDLDLTVIQNLRYYAALHGVSGRDAEARILEILESHRIADRMHVKARELNGGHRRRVEIARALLHRPALLLLDEATVGLDAKSREAIVEQVHTLTSEAGVTVLWATHLVDEIYPDDLVCVLHRGEMILQDTASGFSGDSDLKTRFLALTEDGV
ncbi:MAG: ATP-binding cassette domain-containing protein [Gammaproteobacteria bacterium]|nr:ATP-binding cassette domain-containing protein [Gammaproteobacteria bacterium]